jgi:hypothetical protein
LLIYFDVDTGDTKKTFLFSDAIPKYENTKFGFKDNTVTKGSKTVSDFAIHYIIPEEK